MADETGLPETDLASEQRVLGCILANRHRYYEVRGWVRPKHFADPVHAAIYAAIEAEMAIRGDLRRLSISDDVLAEVDGWRYIEMLCAVFRRPALGAAGEAGQAIHRAWARRCRLEG